MAAFGWLAATVLAAAFALALAVQVGSMANCAIFLITGVPWLW